MTKPHEIRSLTGLRGIAALYVMLYHFKISNFTPAITEQFFYHGYLAVDVFFILSGFVMALTYQSMFKDGVVFQNTKDFIMRRIARIYPLYIVITLIFICFYAFFPNKTPDDVDFSAHVIIPNLLMIQSWGISPSIVSVGWSISTELGAYLLFPILTVAMFGRRNWLPHLIALLGCTTIIILYNLSIGSFYQENNVQNLNIWKGPSIAPLIRCIAEFPIGVWAYRLYNSQSVKEKICLGKIQQPFISLVITIITTILLALPSTDVLIVILIPFLLVSITNDHSIIARFLGWAPIYFIGVISYSLYLCHFMSFWIKPYFINEMAILAIPHPQFLVFILQIVMSLVLAIIFYFGVEKPGRSSFRKLLRQ